MRTPRSKIWILCEGDTEKCYFSVANNLGKLGNTTIEIKKIGQVSGRNINKFKNIMKKIPYSNKELEITNSKVFILLDVDGNNRQSYTEENINFIRENLENDNIRFLFSNKDFELWILLHLQDCRQENINYINLIRTHRNGGRNYEKGYNNNIKFFGKIISNYLDEAIQRARNLEQFHRNKEIFIEKIPYTEVYKIFDL